jgi:hypothetical protein
MPDQRDEKLGHDDQGGIDDGLVMKQQKDKKQRGFDWSKHPHRIRMLLKVAYIGTNYAGIAWQVGRKRKILFFFT